MKRKTYENEETKQLIVFEALFISFQYENILGNTGNYK